MVSYTQLDQHGIKQVLVSSSGRPKAQSLQQEDADFFYYYDRRGGLISKNPKTNLQKHAYWYKHNVKFAKGTGAKSNTCQRITPLTDFESAMGVRSCIPEYRYSWCIRPRYGCKQRTFTEDEWRQFRLNGIVNGKTEQGERDENGNWLHKIDYGELEVIYSMDSPAHVGQGNYNWDQYFREKAGKLNLEVVSISSLEFREKQKPAVVEKVRPNPKEESIASVKIEKPEPIEIEPIKEVTKYSPLMIAGVIAVVVILLLKRRRA